MYLTGDLGRWREGQVELLGRRDFQVKLRGFRIELGEIESAIRAAGARVAVCVVRPGAGGAPALVAYYEHGEGGIVSEANVRDSCKRRLPPYMQPQVVVQLEKLPRNTNGKVDRSKLPEPPEDTTELVKDSEAAISPPSTPTEMAVAQAWAEVLGMDVGKISAEVDFQQVGGSSLLAGRVTALIRKRLNASGLAGTAIYKHSTVKRLAVLVEAARAEQEAADADLVESGKASCQALLPACLPSEPELRSDRPMAMFIQFLGVFCLNFIFESQAWSPFWWEAWFLYRDYGVWALVAYLPIAVVGDLMMQVFLLAALKWIIVGKLKPGKYKLWSYDYFRWWFVGQLNHHVSAQILPLIAETTLASAFFRLLGATIGPGTRISISTITEPDLFVCGEDVTIGKRARISTSAVMHGYLHLGTVRLGDGSAVGPCTVLSQQTEVAADRAVLPLSTMAGWHGPVGAVAHQPAARVCSSKFQRRQDLLRAVFGVPLVAITHCIQYIPVIFVLQWFWAWSVRTFGDEYAFHAFSVGLAWVYVHPIWMTFLAVVCLQKWLIVGRFEPGHQEWSHWAEFRHWLHARAVESHDFEQICQMWINTEVLNMIYRLLGAQVGKRVQIDAFHAVEHDLLTIEDYTVFGSEVVLCCDSRAPWTPKEGICGGCPLGYEPIRLGKGSNVLDHCTVLPGATVAERAVLGTCTLAHHRAYIPPLSIHTGSSRGRSLHLRDHNSNKALRALEDKAMQALEDPIVWWRFNAAIVLITLIAKPIPEALWVVTYFGVTAFWDPQEDSLTGLLLFVPVVYFVVCLIELFVTIGAKWLIIGRYKSGDFPFFGQYHVRWMTMMILNSGISDLAEALQGTVFNSWAYRANGARVGENCYLAGLAVEYDLLEIGDNVAIGAECDTTGHTVENMVIKLAATKIGSGVTMCPASFAMPGSVLERNAVLLEHTQVLKGEVVPQGEVWAGMPAARCQLRSIEQGPAAKLCGA